MQANFIKNISIGYKLDIHLYNSIKFSFVICVTVDFHKAIKF